MHIWGSKFYHAPDVGKCIWKSITMRNLKNNDWLVHKFVHGFGKRFGF